MARRLKLMWDYAAFPLWWDDSGFGTRPPLPDDLADALQRWSDEWSSAMWGDRGPDAPGWVEPDAESYERHNREGRALAERVQAALSDVEGVYWADDPEGPLDSNDPLPDRPRGRTRRAGAWPRTPPGGRPEVSEPGRMIDRDASVFRARQIELARQAVEIVRADIDRTTSVRPRIEVTVDADFLLLLYVATNGSVSHSTLHLYSDEMGDVLTAVADHLQDEVMEELNAAWPVCTDHQFGAHAQAYAGVATWWCRHPGHVVSAVGSLALPSVS